MDYLDTMSVPLLNLLPPLSFLTLYLGEGEGGAKLYIVVFPQNLV